MRPNKLRKFVAALGVTLFTFSMFNIISDSTFDKLTNNHIRLAGRCTEEMYNSSTICTDGCRIPLLTMDKDLIKELENHAFPISKKLWSCKPYPLLGSNRTHIWIEKKNMQHYNLNNSSKLFCCYEATYRQNLNDSIADLVKYQSCRKFTDTIRVKDEFVRVTCGINKVLFDSFFIFAVEKETKGKGLLYNVLILGIDAVSRLNFHRTMPKTGAYLKQLDAVELFGYNKVGCNTIPNLIALLMGINYAEIESAYLDTSGNNSWTIDDCPFIWKRFQQAGFSTALAEDWGIFNDKKRGFQRIPTNYYLDPFMKEAEHYAGNQKFETYACMNEKYFFNMLLDYAEDLTTLRNKLFAFFWECTMSHDFILFPTVMDDSYKEFFKRLDNSGYLNESIIFFISDHGVRYGAFRQTKQGFFEERLPFAFVLMPPSFRNKFDRAFNNLKLNSGRLTTPYDIHATLTDLVDLDTIKNDKISSRSRRSVPNFGKGGKGVSLFLPISGQRTCKSAGIDEYWCMCDRKPELELHNFIAKRAVLHAVFHLNRLLESQPQCAKLVLAKTLKVTRLLPSKEDRIFILMFVMFQTKPGDGVFEALLRGKGWSAPWAVLGSVSRVNSYGNQSYCVSNRVLAIYCYCNERDEKID